MKRARTDDPADLATAFLIGAGLGVAAMMLLRPAPKRRLLQRLARREPWYRDLRDILASLRER